MGKEFRKLYLEKIAYCDQKPKQISMRSTRSVDFPILNLNGCEKQLIIIWAKIFVNVCRIIFSKFHSNFDFSFLEKMKQNWK